MALKDSFRPVAGFFAPASRRGRALVIVVAGVAAISIAAGAILRTGRGGSPGVQQRGAQDTPERPPGLPRELVELGTRLPLERKVAQLFLWGFRGPDPIGAVVERRRELDLGGIVLARGNYAGTERLRRLAREAGDAQSENRLRPWVIAPQQGGEFNAFPDLPPRDAPGDLRSADEAAAQATDAARILRALGVTGVLGPNVDVGFEDDPQGARVYSDDPGDVAAFATATIRAYTGRGLLSAPQHFPGLGAASEATEAGPAQVGLTLGELSRRDLVPFAASFDAGAPAVVLSHALYVMDDFTTPGSLSRRVATDLLRRRFRFPGLAITDDLSDPGITAISSLPRAAVQAIRAGADMVYISGPRQDQDAAYAAVLRAAHRGDIPRRRLEEAVFRVLAAKRRFGLLR